MSDFNIEKSVGFLLVKAYQHIYANFRAQLEPYGITPQQFALLAFLWQQDGLSQTELSHKTEIDRTTIGGLIDRLAKLGLVRRSRHATDRRIYRICLTPTGRDLEKTLIPLALDVRRGLTENLAPGEYDQLCTLLAKLRKGKEDNS